MPTDSTVAPPLPPTLSSSTLNSHDLNELGTDSPGHPAKAPSIGGTHISESQEYGVKVQEYPKEDEEDTEAGDAYTNLCKKQRELSGEG